MKVRIATILLALWLLHLGVALGSIAGPRKHEVDPAMAFDDFKPPATPRVELVKVVRGRGPRVSADGGSEFVSTDGTGSATFNLQGLEDNMSLASEIGLRVRCIGGQRTVASLYVPNYDFMPYRDRASGKYSMSVSWSDGRSNKQEPISFSLEIYAVDKAGILSAHADTVLIEDPGR